MVENYLSGKDEQDRTSLSDDSKRLTYDLYDHDQIEKITRLARHASPGYGADSALIAIYAAMSYLGPLSDEEVKNMTVVSTPGVRLLPCEGQAEMLTRAMTMSRDPNPEPSMLVLDPAIKEKRKEDGERTIVLPFLAGSKKVWIIKDDYGDPNDPESVPIKYRNGVRGRYLVTCLLPEEY